MDTIEIPLSSGDTTIIDAEDAPLVAPYQWRIHYNRTIPYVTTSPRVNGKRIWLQMHRMVMGAKQGQIVDHIDRDTFNNRKSNLRIVTPQQNALNKGLYASNTSGFKGVTRASSGGKWRASIRKDYRKYHLGHFVEKEDAARAYDAAAREMYGEYASLNFPDDEVSK